MIKMTIENLLTWAFTQELWKVGSAGPGPGMPGSAWDMVQSFAELGTLIDRAQAGGVREIILAVNATVEGQTTAHYITDQLSGLEVKITRLAHGVPVGGELDYLDEGTLTAALRARTAI